MTINYLGKVFFSSDEYFLFTTFALQFVIKLEILYAFSNMFLLEVESLRAQAYLEDYTEAKLNPLTFQRTGLWILENMLVFFCCCFPTQHPIVEVP